MNRKLKIKILIILLIILIILLFFMGISIAKEKINIEQRIKALVAKPILNLEQGKLIEIDNKTPKNKYEFCIKNFEAEEINEVPIQYTIEIISPENKEIKFKLLQGEKEIKLINNKTEYIYLEKNNKVEHHYQLEINYNQENIENKNDIIGNIQIKIHSEQIRR